jgi:hypothetical protein
VRCSKCIYSWSPYAMFSARGVALNVTTASAQLRMLQNSVYLPRGRSYQQLTVLVHIVAMETNLRRLPDDAIHVSGFVPPKRLSIFNRVRGVIVSQYIELV